MLNKFAPLSNHREGDKAVFLHGSPSSSFDHLRYGKQFTHFRYPPKIEGFLSFKDTLQETIPNKIKQITARMKKIEAERKQTMANAAKCKDGWFLKMYADARFEEYAVCQKWLNYWLIIWDELNGKKAPKAANNIDIARAKQFPIENLYTGQLRSFGGKLKGLCPLHEEKTPSFTIFPDNSFYCFGCQEFGDSVDFLMKVKGYDFKEAVRNLT